MGVRKNMPDMKVSSIYSFIFLYDNERIYLVNTIYSKSLFSLPKAIEKVTLDAYLIDQQEASYFEVENKKSVGTVSMVLITQPLVALIYNFGKYIFQNLGVSYSVAIKLLLLLIVLAVTLLSCRIYLRSLEKKIPKHIISPKNQFSLKVYKPKVMTRKIGFLNKLLGYILGWSIVGVPLYLYLKINNGGESILLMVISAVFFFIYISTRMSPIVAPAFKDYDIVIERADHSRLA